jgi:transposase
MAMLADLVDLVIGVDTHKHTHTAAVVTATTGAVVEQATVPATPAGYRQLLALADAHAEHDRRPARRVWAIEGTGGYGAGLTRALTAAGEQVVELDRPARPARRHGTKSDPLDAARAAREALGRDRLAQPRAGGQRAALSVRLAARRSAVQAACVAQRQLQTLVVAAPELLRARLRTLATRELVISCARLRQRTDTDTETTTTVASLRALARRVQMLEREVAEHTRALTALVRAWRPDLLARPGVGPIVAATVLCAWSHPGRTLLPPWSDPLRGSVRDAGRHRPDPGLQRPDRALPAHVGSLGG